MRDFLLTVLDRYRRRQRDRARIAQIRQLARQANRAGLDSNATEFPRPMGVPRYAPPSWAERLDK